jgi:hypothetical protein
MSDRSIYTMPRFSKKLIKKELAGTVKQIK